MLNSEDVKKFAQDTLENQTATEAEKNAARAAITRINSTARKPRPRRPKRNQFASDEEHAQALFEFRSKLDLAAREREASAILDSHTSSVYLRKKARALLYGEDPEPAELVEPVKAAEAPKPSHSRLTTTELAEQSTLAQKFIDSLGQPDIPAEPLKREPEAKKVEPPKPIDPKFNCEFCRVPFSICFCNVLSCPLCFRSKANCCAPCPNARVRN